MEIIKYIKLSSGKYKVLFNNKKELILYESVIIDTNLLYKKEITSEEYNNLVSLNNYQDIYNKVIKYIGIILRSKKEIITFLNKNKVGESDKEKIINKLESIKLINDELFANAYSQDRINLSSDGPYKIINDLRKNDISEEIIEKVISKIDEDLIYEKLKKLIVKKINSNHNKSNYMLKQKTIIDMTNLGYDKEMIIEIIDENKCSNSNIINNEYKKIYTKFSKKYEGIELERLIKNKLIQKGFSSEEIENIEVQKN